jgi:hypothetical protein
MTWLARVFASAVVRRIAGLLVVAVLAQLAMCTKAHATTYEQAMSTCSLNANYSCSDNGSKNCEYGTAMPNGSGQVCGINAQMCGGATHTCQAYSYSYTPCPTGEQWNTFTHKCDVSCSEKPEEFGWLYDSEHEHVCSGGCVYDGGINLDGTTSYLPSGGTCSNEPPPLIDSDGDGVADPLDAFPNDPNESSDSDGDGVGDNADTDPGHPDNGGDNGDGNESDNQASGGGTCNSPPACSGDAIACNTNYQVWKARCAMENASAVVTGSPEVCNGSYTCTGNSAQCAQIKVLRVAACKDVSTGGGTGPKGDQNENGVADVLEGDGTGYTPGTPGGISEDDGTGSVDGLDGGGWLGSGQGSCPGLPMVNGVPIDGFVCGTGGQLLYSFMILLGFVFASVIIGRAASGT